MAIRACCGLTRNGLRQRSAAFFEFYGEARSKQLQFVRSDMWPAYLKVIKECASQALHILDRFHIVAKLNKSLDEIRAAEHKQLKADG